MLNDTFHAKHRPPARRGVGHNACHCDPVANRNRRRKVGDRIDLSAVGPDCWTVDSVSFRHAFASYGYSRLVVLLCKQIQPASPHNGCLTTPDLRIQPSRRSGLQPDDHKWPKEKKRYLKHSLPRGSSYISEHDNGGKGNCPRKIYLHFRKLTRVMIIKISRHIRGGLYFRE